MIDRFGSRAVVENIAATNFGQVLDSILVLVDIVQASRKDGLRDSQMPQQAWAPAKAGLRVMLLISWPGVGIPGKSRCCLRLDSDEECSAKSRNKLKIVG